MDKAGVAPACSKPVHECLIVLAFARRMIAPPGFYICEAAVATHGMQRQLSEAAGNSRRALVATVGQQQKSLCPASGELLGHKDAACPRWQIGDFAETMPPVTGIEAGRLEANRI